MRLAAPLLAPRASGELMLRHTQMAAHASHPFVHITSVAAVRHVTVAAHAAHAAHAAQAILPTVAAHVTIVHAHAALERH